MTRREQRIKIMTCIYQYLLTGKKIDDIFDENLELDDKESISFIKIQLVSLMKKII